MRQTVEETAKQYVANHPNSNPSIEFPEWDGVDVYDAFKAGAEWQAKQSPWISVEMAIPKDDSPGVVQVITVDGKEGEMAARRVMTYPVLMYG